MSCRTERDFIGDRNISDAAYYGINAMRGHENFNVSGDAADAMLVRALAWVKKACVLANLDDDKIDKDIAAAIGYACDKVADGSYDGQFIVNPLQGGGGTSLNMNMNEVITNVALELIGYAKGRYDVINPLVHVNMSQSTNDVFPTAINIALMMKLKPLLQVLSMARDTLLAKSQELASVMKMGRTHLNAASFISFGRCFDAYAAMLTRDCGRIDEAMDNLHYVPLGGTVVGTGLNTTPEYRRYAIKRLRQISGVDVEACANLADGIQNVDCYTSLSSSLKTCILNLSKVASDLRLLGSEPQYGFGELSLPPRQMGSSIIPDKVNPVMAELINQIVFLVCGYDLTVIMAAQSGQLELNVYKPVIAFSLFKSIDMMTNAIRLFNEFCLKGIRSLKYTYTDEVYRIVQDGLPKIMGLYKV